jgi:hypothetical protein
MVFIEIRCESVDGFEVPKFGPSPETNKMLFEGVAGFNWLTTESRDKFLYTRQSIVIFYKGMTASLAEECQMGHEVWLCSMELVRYCV